MKTITAALALLLGVTSLFAQVEFHNGAEYCSLEKNETRNVHAEDLLCNIPGAFV